MGNCLRQQSSMQWGGEDWGSPARDLHDGLIYTSSEYQTTMKVEEEEKLLHQDVDFSFSSSPKSTAKTTEVKIKITKKQLEELLGKADVKELSVQQVLAQLVSVCDGYEANQRSWRPALQSIPEVD